MPKHKRLYHNELLERLKTHGIYEDKKRGKGSERMLYQLKTRLNYPITCHGKNPQHSIRLLKAIMRRFSLPDDFLF